MESGISGYKHKSKAKAKLIFKILAVLAVIALLFWIQGQFTHINAGIGNHNDYSQSSDSSQSDSDGDIEGLIWLIYLLFRSGPVGIIIVIILIVVYIKNKDKINSGMKQLSESNRQTQTAATDRTSEIAAEIKENDPNFSAQRFIEWGKEVYIQLQRAWSLRDWKLARPFESDSLFKTHQIQLQEYIDTGRINKLENICVNTAYLTKHEIQGEYEFLTMRMSVRLNDWQIDENTGAVVKGDPNFTYRLTYDLKFMRSVGTLTNAETSNKSTTNCPNCGAPTDITSSGQCRYCDSVITTGKHDWVLCEVNSVQ